MGNNFFCPVQKSIKVREATTKPHKGYQSKLNILYEIIFTTIIRDSIVESFLWLTLSSPTG